VKKKKKNNEAKVSVEKKQHKKGANQTQRAAFVEQQFR
jgi:hypothetical protein